MEALGQDVLFLPSGLYMSSDEYLESAEAHGRDQAEKYLAARRLERAAAG
jgi:hypothetical protein